MPKTRIVSLPVSRFFDAHLHGLDFLQDGEGFENLLREMDSAGVERTVVFGLPVVKKWSAGDPLEPHYYLDDNSRCYYYSYTDQIIRTQWEKLPAADRPRLAPLLCGFNPTDLHAIKHIERLLAEWPEWRGIGEILLRHDDLTNLTEEETARANHPGLASVYACCADRGLPILIHQNSTSIGRHDVYVYLHELEEVLEAHPGVTVVWAHCGLSRRVFHARYHEMIRGMLSRFPRLHADISWVCRESVLPHRGTVREGWIPLIEEFSDRFVLGSDLTGHFHPLTKTIASFSPLLEQLSDPARENVAWRNAARIYFRET